MNIVRYRRSCFFIIIIFFKHCSSSTHAAHVKYDELVLLHFWFTVNPRLWFSFGCISNSWMYLGCIYIPPVFPDSVNHSNLLWCPFSGNERDIAVYKRDSKMLAELCKMELRSGWCTSRASITLHMRFLIRCLWFIFLKQLSEIICCCFLTCCDFILGCLSWNTALKLAKYHQKTLPLKLCLKNCFNTGFNIWKWQRWIHLFYLLNVTIIWLALIWLFKGEKLSILGISAHLYLTTPSPRKGEGYFF